MSTALRIASVIIVAKAGRERAKGFRTKAAGKAWLDEIVSAQVTGTYIDPESGKMTFASYYREWSSHQLWESGTRKAMDLAVNSAAFRDAAFQDLKPSHIEAWVKEMLDKPLQPSTIRTRFNNVRGVIRAAVRDRFLAHDVTAKVKLPRQRKAEAEMSIPSPAELANFSERLTRSLKTSLRFAHSPAFALGKPRPSK